MVYYPDSLGQVGRYCAVDQAELSEPHGGVLPVGAPVCGVSEKHELPEKIKARSLLFSEIARDRTENACGTGVQAME
jgi:hypothetical protein